MSDGDRRPLGGRFDRSRLAAIAGVAAFLLHAGAVDGQAPGKGASPRPAGVSTVAADPVAVIVDPIGGPAASGQAFSVYGDNFTAGTPVSIGGLAATGMTLAADGHLDAVTPALAPGTLNDVVVTGASGVASTLADAWFARFADVAPSFLYDRAIEKMVRTGITLGCGGGNYCPNDSVTRAQMAIFILRGEHGGGYVPPDATGNVFDDVPATAFGANFIEEMFAEGITTGCAVKKYCPDNSVTRGEMAVFLMRAKFGSSYQPPAPAGVFTDVPPGAPFAKWIEKLASEGVTSGCGGGKYCPTSPNTRGEMAVFLTKTFSGSSQSLIADALAHGDIDYPTSLLYRAYALFLDPRLPSKYAIGGSEGEDNGLFVEMQAILPELTSVQQAQLNAYLVRPDDPQSVFGPAPTGMRPNDEPTTNCETQWVGWPSPEGHFVVHGCSHGDLGNDQELLVGIGQIADPLYDAETIKPPGGMGPPIADTGGGDSKIDLYVIALGQCSPRRPSDCPHLIQSKSIGVAYATDAFVNKSGGVSSSAYMLVAESLLGTPSFKSTIAHELFHVLQMAHNRGGMFQSRAQVRGRPLLQECWYVEASAAWAEWKYVPESVATEVYPRFEVFQQNNESLLEWRDTRHMYESFIWPFFMQQEGGSGAPIFQSWVHAEGAKTPAGITNAVDEVTSFQSHFRDFAVRNENEDLPGHPQDVAYWELDSNFPKDVVHRITNHFTIRLSAVRPPVEVKIEPLAAQFDRYNVDPLVRKIVLRFDDIAKADVDVLAKIRGTYKRFKVDTSRPLTFCREHADEDVSALVVILSNHDKTEGNVLKGSYKIEQHASCCSDFPDVAAWNAHITFSYSQVQSVGDYQFDLKESADVKAHLIAGGLGTWIGTPLAGSANLNDTETFQGSETDMDGSGAPLPGGQIQLSIDVTKCTFGFVTSPILPNATIDGQGPVPTLVGTPNGVAEDLSDFVDTIHGSEAFPTHSDAVGEPTKKSYYFPGGLGQTMLIQLLVGQQGENVGSAQVTWEFAPDPPLPPD